MQHLKKTSNWLHLRGWEKVGPDYLQAESQGVLLFDIELETFSHLLYSCLLKSGPRDTFTQSPARRTGPAPDPHYHRSDWKFWCSSAHMAEDCFWCHFPLPTLGWERVKNEREYAQSWAACSQPLLCGPPHLWIGATFLPSLHGFTMFADLNIQSFKLCSLKCLPINQRDCSALF